MTQKRCNCRMHALMAQFFYEHRCLDGGFRKVRKSADELCKILDCMSSPKLKDKEKKKEK